MTCKHVRVNDQYHCSCGLQWDIDEDDPHYELIEDMMLFGSCFVKDGKRVPLADVFMLIDEDGNETGRSIPTPRVNKNRTIGNKALIKIKENLNRE